MFRRIPHIVALLLFASLPGAAKADDKDGGHLARKEVDDRVNRILYEVISAGVAVFNGGDEAGCYRLYQGCLMSIAPLLDHRPDLKAEVERALKTADTLRTPSDKAFALRTVMDNVRKGVRKEIAPVAERSLWDRLGGEKAVQAVVHEFVASAAKDPKVNFLRDGKFKIDDTGVAHLEQLLVELVSAVAGGPLKYSGKDMKSVHAGMAISDAEFDALAGHLVATLKKFHVPQKEIDELAGIVAGTRKDIVEKSLWARLGGEKAVRAVVHEFVVNAAQDPKVNFLRDGKVKIDDKGVAQLEQLLVELVSAVGGGPLKYSGRDMKTAHAGMAITDAEFDALAGHLVAALKKFNAPQKEIDELVGIIAGTRKDIVEKK